MDRRNDHESHVSANGTNSTNYSQDHTKSGTTTLRLLENEHKEKEYESNHH